MKTRVTGLTLIELIIALAIVAILAARALPAFADFYERAETRVVTNRLIRFLHYARINAIKHNKPVIICGSTDGLACIPSKFWSGQRLMVYMDVNNDRAYHPDDDRLLRVSEAMPAGSFLVFRAFRNRHYLKWLPVGTTDTQNGHFTYCPPSGNLTLARHLILNIAGRIDDGKDSNGDGIVERRDGTNLVCS